MTRIRAWQIYSEIYLVVVRVIYVYTVVENKILHKCLIKRKNTAERENNNYASFSILSPLYVCIVGVAVGVNSIKFFSRILRILSIVL